MIHYMMCLLVLGPSLYSIAEGCGRVPATPPPTVIPTTTAKTINGSQRSIECTSEEINRTACLNGGNCFVLVIGKDRLASCHCTPEYMGTRCDELNIIYFTTKENNLAKAGIAASIGVLVVITIVFVAVAIVYYRRRKQERRAQVSKNSQPNENGGVHQLLPENHIQPNPITRYKNGNSNYNHINFEEKKPLTYFPYQTTAV